MLIALLLAAFAYGRFKKVKKPERSIASAKETAAVLQQAKPHPRAVESAPRAAQPLGPRSGPRGRRRLRCDTLAP